METKTHKAVTLYTSGKHIAALKMFSKFKIGISIEESRILQIAYESLTGKESFYRSLQIDTAVAVS